MRILMTTVCSWLVCSTVFIVCTGEGQASCTTVECFVFTCMYVGQPVNSCRETDISTSGTWKSENGIVQNASLQADGTYRVRNRQYCSLECDPPPDPARATGCSGYYTGWSAPTTRYICVQDDT